MWAVVGASPDRSRPSFGVLRFLRRQGYRVIPVNPLVAEVDGLPCYPDLASIPAHEGVEVVDVFRRSEHVAGIVEEAIAIGAKAVWCQLGVIDFTAHQRALAAGLDVVMDVCPAIEHPRLV
ncbi:MAG TPA: CoA-binding protein [Mycobacteriales bacterium]|nr:CoA-binding protein [Mycobacteriales bacterium]